MTTGPIVTNEDREWAIKQCPSWMRREMTSDLLDEIVDDGDWLDVDANAEVSENAPSATYFVLEEIEKFERYPAWVAEQKTYAEWSRLWRTKWWPKADPARRYPKHAPKTKIDPAEYESRLKEILEGGR